MASPNSQRRGYLVGLLLAIVTAGGACDPGGSTSSRIAPQPSSAEPEATQAPARGPRGRDRRSFYPATIAFWDERRGLAAGTLETPMCRAHATCDDVVQLTSDGGETWRTVFRRPESFVSLATTGSKRAWLTVTGCKKSDPCLRGLWASVDGGSSWKQIVRRHLEQPSFAGRTGWAVRSESDYPRSGRLGRTLDAGRTWQIVESPCSRTNWTVGVSASGPRSAMVFCATEGATYMMGKSVFVTSDRGATWQLRAVAPLSPYEKDPFPDDGLSNGAHASGVFFEEGAAGWLWGGRGYFQLSVDGGWTWARAGHRAVEPDALSIVDLWMVSRDTGFALINTGRLMRTSSGGRAWHGIRRFP